MLRELVSGLDLDFFAIASLLLFVAVWLVVVTRSLCVGRREHHAAAMSPMIDGQRASDAVAVPGGKRDE